MVKVDKANQIHNIKIPRKDTNMNLKECLKKTVETVKNRIEKEVPDVGYFRNFAEDFKNPDENIYASAISISVERVAKTDGNASLCLNILHPTMFLNASSALASGNRKQLLEAINDANFIDKVETCLKNLSEKMKNID